MTDREIINEILHRGRTRLYGELMSRYRRLVFARSMAVLKRTDLAADATQQTFIRAFDRLSDFRGEELGTWLSIIAAHTAIRMLEKERRYTSLQTENAQQEPPNSNSTEAKDRENLLLKMEQAIDQLPPDDRQIIRLHYFKQMKTDDIARQTGLSQSNVLVRLHRIRQRLKQHIAHENHL